MKTARRTMRFTLTNGNFGGSDRCRPFHFLSAPPPNVPRSAEESGKVTEVRLSGNVQGAIYEQRGDTRAQHSDELYCFQHCYEALHLAETACHASRGCPHYTGSSSHISVCWAQLSGPRGRISLAFSGVR